MPSFGDIEWRSWLPIFAVRYFPSLKVILLAVVAAVTYFLPKEIPDSVVEYSERNWNEKFFAALDRRSRVHFGLSFSPLGKLSLYGPFIELWTVGGLMELYEYPHVDPTFYVLDTLEVVGTYPAHFEQ